MYDWFCLVVILENILKQDLCIFVHRLRGGGENYMRDWRNIINFILLF